MADYLGAVLLGIVEGLTEFLPVSSTGHLILASDLVGFHGKFANMFNVFIQLGAVLAVVIYFRQRLFGWKSEKNRIDKSSVYQLWSRVLIGFVPALIAGLVFGETIESKLFNHTVVAVSLISGGAAIILIEKKKYTGRLTSIESLSYLKAFYIGIAQCVAMVPGVSRSAATIIGAMLIGASRITATEFSFFLSIPTIIAAAVYSFLKISASCSGHQIRVLITGFIVSFLVALGVIAVFMDYIKKRSFKPFGYYRVVLGIIVILYFGLS